MSINKKFCDIKRDIAFTKFIFAPSSVPRYLSSKVKLKLALAIGQCFSETHNSMSPEGAINPSIVGNDFHNCSFIIHDCN